MSTAVSPRRFSLLSLTKLSGVFLLVSALYVLIVSVLHSTYHDTAGLFYALGIGLGFTVGIMLRLPRIYLWPASLAVAVSFPFLLLQISLPVSYIIFFTILTLVEIVGLTYLFASWNVPAFSRPAHFVALLIISVSSSILASLMLTVMYFFSGPVMLNSSHPFWVLATPSMMFGLICIMPAVIRIKRPSFEVKRNTIAFAILFSVLVLADIYLFFIVTPDSPSILGWPYLLIIVLGWIAIRLGVDAAAPANAVVFLFAVQSTLNGHGLFSLVDEDATSQDPFLTALVFAIVISSVSLLLAILRDERIRSMKILSESHQLLEENETMLTAVLDSSRDVVSRINTQGEFSYVNQRVEDVSGVPVEDWLGQKPETMGFPEPISTEWAKKRAYVFSTGNFTSFEFQIEEIDGSRWYEMSISPEFNEERTTVVQVVSVSRDITHRVEMMTQLEKSEQLLLRSEHIAHLGNWTFDYSTSHITWSEEFFSILKLDPAEGIPNFSDQEKLYTAESWGRLTIAMEKAYQEGSSYELELELVHPDGTHGWILVRGEPVLGKDGTVTKLQGTALDITSIKTANSELAYLATHDSLTGLANRPALVEEISRALNSAQHKNKLAAVLMMDLDYFKNINDTLGHEAGDGLLLQVAERLNRSARGGDMVGRLGGDEFVIVLRDIESSSEARQSAEIIVRVFQTPFHVNGLDLFITGSVGISFSAGSNDGEDMLRDADIAMYASKKAGRNRISLFDESLREKVTERMTIETDLRQALMNDELDLWYQPEVNLTTGEIIAVEALLRWRHPDGTIWTADKFIDVAEESGMILAIGEQVIRKAFQKSAEWERDYPERALTVRFNLSALQLSEAGLLPTIDRELAASGANPALLCAEITETTLLVDTPIASSNLAGVSERGISLAIDDFGIGYASLSYLHRYPIDIIKIDRSFVTSLVEDEHTRKLVAGIISFAQQIEIDVTAEGVEEGEQAAALVALGCIHAQGWLYSPALPSDEIVLLFPHPFPPAVPQR